MIVNTIKEGKPYSFDLNGTQVVLEESDMLIETTKKPGFVSHTYNEVTVVLNTNLDEKLVEEGFVRETISKIQTMRKEAGFEVMDRIVFYYTGNEKITGIIDKNRALIADEVLADEILGTEPLDGSFVKDWNINKETVTFAVKKV
jgi:isoleucyl-tRNA synthetase